MDYSNNKREAKWSYNEKTTLITFIAPWTSTYYIELNKMDKDKYSIYSSWKSDNDASTGATYATILDNQARKNYLKKLEINKRFNSYMSFNKKIENYVDSVMAEWEMQGEFEKTTKFKLRVNENSKNEKKIKLKMRQLIFIKN